MTRITGLPLDASPKSVAELITEIGVNILDTCVRIASPNGDSKTLAADIRVEDPLFATSLCHNLESLGGKRALFLSRHGVPHLSVIPTTSAALGGVSSHSIDCRKVICSWHKSARLAWVNFRRDERAMTEFCDRSFLVNGRTIKGEPKVSYNSYTALLKDLPGQTTKRDLSSAMRISTDQIELGTPSYTATDEDTITAVNSLMSKYGPIALWDASTTPSAKRIKVKVRFQYEVDAREAVKQLDKKNLPILSKGKLSVQLMISAKFKITTDIFDIVRPQIMSANKLWAQNHVHLSEYRNTDIAQRFTTLRLEGESGEEVASAKNALENIIKGTVAEDTSGLIWSESFRNRSGQHKLKSIEEATKVVIVCDKVASRLRVYGSPEKVEEAQRLIADLAKAESSTVHVIKLEVNEFWRAKHGAFQRIVSALGRLVASIDIISTTKRILITGSTEQYEKALAIMDGAQIDGSDAPIEESVVDQDCTICWTPAEKPIRTKCNHLYCLECFESMCSSASTSNNEFSICCQGDAGNCSKSFPLEELQDHLSSNTFEDMLAASLKSYIRRRPQEFAYCPNPNCDQIYRLGGATTNTRTCPKCLLQMCIACKSAHAGMTCAEYKYASSAEGQAFEKFKKEKGFKDCPRCKTTMEKTEGCNHMTCSGCGTHICWACLANFDVAQECYDHMNKVHGGIGLGEGW
ncbi:Zinc finger C6HC-type protein [Rutstroemia sp. NJR-2017a BVV2]|nr:Zinc finger C6HC-type protein [Rutstroemia sp. NJR-2017a BVV2]PQE19715.1 Zinc finger C6HC-type protein [Rutstroemia sp. NJR-2017a BVV2]